MPGYTYTGKTRTGETRTGYVEAKDEHEVARLLRSEGLLLISAQTSEKSSEHPSLAHFNFFRRVPFDEVMLFARYMATMIGAGLPMARALEVLVEQAETKYFKKVLAEILEAVKGGQGLGDTLAHYPEIFSDLFVNMVRVGEVSGNLEQVLKLLARQMQKDHDLRSRVRGAMIYPAVIFLALIGVGTIMMIYVVPQLASTFRELNVALPPTTLFVIKVAELAEQFWYLIPVLFISLFVLIRILARTDFGKRFLHALILKAPMIGPLAIKINVARFSRLLSSLMKSGVPIVQALDIMAHTLTNVYYKDSLKQASTDVEHGKQLHEFIVFYPNLYPPLLKQMVQVGEETAAIEELLLRLAIFYEKEVDNITKNLSKIIEPILMLVIGTAVGFFAISMIQPIYSLVGAIK